MLILFHLFLIFVYSTKSTSLNNKNIQLVKAKQQECTAILYSESKNFLTGTVLHITVQNISFYIKEFNSYNTQDFCKKGPIIFKITTTMYTCYCNIIIHVATLALLTQVHTGTIIQLMFHYLASKTLLMSILIQHYYIELIKSITITC